MPSASSSRLLVPYRIWFITFPSSFPGFGWEPPSFPYQYFPHTDPFGNAALTEKEKRQLVEKLALTKHDTKLTLPGHSEAGFPTRDKQATEEGGHGHRSAMEVRPGVQVPSFQEIV